MSQYLQEGLGLEQEIRGALKGKGMLSMQYGGVVPGPIGMPVPITAHGGEVFSGVGAKTQTGGLHVHIGSFMGDEMSLRDLTRRLQELMREEERRTAFSGINAGYFYGGSHP